ncbi:MAG: mechanosensitive ion channel family protein [Actinomycetota bacterium]
MLANLFLDSLNDLWDKLITLLPNIGAALLVFLAFFLVARMARFISRKHLGRFDISDLAAKMLSRIFFIVIMLIGVLVSLGIMGINAGALVASAGLLGVALGFALGGVVENFAAGLVLIWQKPFEAGDLVIMGEVEGEVKDVRISSTTIKMYDGRQVSVPNAKIFSDPVTNNTRNRLRRLDFEVGIAYEDDVAKALRTASGALESIEGVLDEPPAMVVAKEFADSSVALQVYFWIDPVEANFLAVKSEAIEAVKKAFDEADIEIPFPIVTVRGQA